MQNKKFLKLFLLGIDATWQASIIFFRQELDKVKHLLGSTPCLTRKY
jgi:hypothetical protein